MQLSLKQIGLLILLLMIAGLAYWFYPDSAAQAQKVALAQRVLATRTLADYLATNHLGKQAVIISNPFTQQSGHPHAIYAFEAAGIRGLQQGFGKTIMLDGIEYPDLRPASLQNPASLRIDPNTTTPLSFLVTDKAFDQAVLKHPECDLLVSLIGLPANLNQCASWQNSSRPKFALLLPDLRLIGNIAAIREAFVSGKIAAAVLNRPSASTDTLNNSHDQRSEFNHRFLLLTPETIDGYLEKYPQLF